MKGNKLLLTMTPDIHGYLAEASDKLGISMSSYVSMLVGKDREQNEALALLRKIPEEKLAELLKGSAST